MNNDLISREALKEEFKRIYRCAETAEQLANNMEDAIDNAPIVEYTFEEAFQKTVCENKLYCPARPQGCWKRGEFGSYCSICGYAEYRYLGTGPKHDHNFCPECGADMRGDNNG